MKSDDDRPLYKPPRFQFASFGVVWQRFGTDNLQGLIAENRRMRSSA
jgi:hypothetical protein